MSYESRRKMVEAYVERYTKQFQSDRDLVLHEQDTNFEAWEEFFRLVNEEPEEAWLSILEVLEATKDEYTLGMLSAGPLEDLIEMHGEQFIERIEALAKTDQRFRELLGGVWKSSTPEVWNRICQVQGEHGEPDA